MKGIILHGGHGTRLRPLTHTGPKQLLPIANKPMSQYCVESLKDAGIKEIAIIIGGVGSSKVKEYYGTGEKFGVKFTYIHQEQPLGIAHAISLCKKFVGNEKFIVFLGDNILERSILEYKEKFEESDVDASILLCEVNNPSRFGIADVKNGMITKIMEKPKEPPTNLAVTGIYFLTPIIFDIISRLKPSWRDELEITDALQMLLEERNKITYFTVTDYWKDTGTSEDIIHANKFILNQSKSYFQGKKESDVILEGTIMVGENTMIKKGAKIVGPVIIGKNCIIDSNTKIGPNASIGDDSIISKCSVTDSIIMSGCNIEGDFNIKDSIIAFNCVLVAEKNKNQSFVLGEGTKISL